MKDEIPASNIMCLVLVNRQSEATNAFDFVRAKSLAQAHCYPKSITKQFDKIHIPMSKQPWIFALHFCAN